MMPFYFGPSDRALYGVYEAAAGRSRRGMVICQAFGEEYFNAHRPARLLAKQLASGGVHALRFDYLGTGDSAREIEEVGIDDWREDIELAMEELKDVAGVSSIGLIGLRMGATLALEASLRRPGIDRLVLWDPVWTHGSPDESPSFVPDFGSLLDQVTGQGSADTLLMCSSEGGPSAADAARMADRGPNFAIHRENERGAWESEGGIGALPIPVRSIKSISDWCRDA